MGLSIIRNYNSLQSQDLGMGVGWITPFHKRLELWDSTGYDLIARQGSGYGEKFICSVTPCNHWRDATMALAKDANGYTLTHRDNSIERYDLTRKLQWETDSAGRTTTYGYDANGRLSTVTGPFGHTLTFAYDASNHVATVTDSAGNVMAYSYHTNAYNDGTTASVVLTGMTYRDSTGANIGGKIYHYEDSRYPNLITGVSDVDAAGTVTRYSTFGYFFNSANLADTRNGNAILTQLAQTDNGSPQEKFAISYDSATQTTVTDPVGTQEVYTYATTYVLKILTSKVNQSDGLSIQQTFDGNNNLTCRKDEAGHVTTYTYNSTNQRTGMTAGRTGSCTSPVTVTGVTRTTSYQYRSTTLDLPTVITSPSVSSGHSKTTTIRYTDAAHPNLPTIITQSGFTPAGTAVSRIITLGYNTNGQLSSVDGPRTDVADVTTLAYNVCTTGYGCGLLSSVTNALGHVTTYDSYDANGRLLQMTGPNGLKTSYTYDARGRVKTITQTPLSGAAALWQYSYTAWGDVSQVIDPDGVVLNYQYDAAHYLQFIVDAAGNYIHYTYDLKGNRTGEDVYDAGSNLTGTVSYAYDLRNHVSAINLAGNTTQLVYDAVGNLTSETDPNTHTTAHTPDALNRLIQTVDALNGVTAYGYDVNDRSTVVTTPNNLTTQYKYDDLGNLLQEVSPDRGITNYTYDTQGNVLTVNNTLGQITTYTYDALNRVASKTSSDGNTPSYTYVYDGCSNKGRLCYIYRNGSTQLLFSYDGLGRLNYQLDLTTSLYSNYVFSPAGRLTHLDYPNGASVDYQYDTLGRVNQVSATSADGTTTTLASALTYYPFGPANSFSFGNGQYYFMNVDQAYRPAFQRSGPRVKTARYDPASNLYELDDFNGTTQSFAYDTLNELTGATDTQAGSYGSLSYSYLSNGNRGTETRTGSTLTYTYLTNRNRLSDTDSLYWLYDAAGNATWSSYAYVMGYDGYGRMVSALSGAAIYDYNAFDQRTTKTAGGITTRFHYGLQGELLYESRGGKAYVYLNGMPLARIDGTSVYYYHTDQLGAPQLMTDSAGATVWKAKYEPFGAATVNEDPDGNGVKVTNNLRLPGQYFDAETGLYYNGYRYYDPRIGRYISSDPIGLKGGLNTYLYARANPLRYIDPLGLWEMYGNWGGANWSGGVSAQDIPKNPKPPVDSLDQCFMAHDYCYASMGKCSSPATQQVTTEKSCDLTLLQCISGLPSNTSDWPLPAKNPVYGNNQHSPTADWWRSKADWWFRQKWKLN